MSSGLSAGLLKLLDERIDGFEKLELIVLLCRAPAKSLSLRDLTSSLALDRSDVRRFATELNGVGLVKLTPTGDVRLELRNPDDNPLLDELARTYDTDKMVLVMTIAEASMNRLRNLAGRAFADAFVLRKPPRGG